MTEIKEYAYPKLAFLSAAKRAAYSRGAIREGKHGKTVPWIPFLVFSMLSTVYIPLLSKP
ncbi:MAG: hypothetical protein WAX23_03280 [Methanosarcina sp.]